MTPIDDRIDLEHTLSDRWIESRAAELEVSLASRTRTRRRWPRPVAVAACALSIALAVAVAPSILDRGPTSSVGPDTAAARTLAEAAEAAGREDWRPLDDGEFAYVRTQIYMDPNGPLGSLGPHGVPSDEHFRPALDRELWVGANGELRSLEVDHGFFGGNRHMPGVRTVNNHRLVIRDLTTARLIYVSSVEGGRWTQRAFAMFDGKFRDVSGPMHIPGDTRSTSAASIQRMNWGATLDELQHLPTEQGDLDKAIADLLDSQAQEQVREYQELPTREHPLADIVRRNEYQNATQLLGGAPLNPAARKALFRWLAQRPGAVSLGLRSDHLGRMGVAIRFGWHIRRVFPPRTVSERQLVNESIVAGATDLHVEIGKRRFHIPAYKDRQDYQVTVIVDVDNGRLLQRSDRAWSSGGWVGHDGGVVSIPYIAAPIRGVRHVRTSTQRLFGDIAPASSAGKADDTVWIATGRPTNTDSRMSFCPRFPSVCRGNG